MAGREAFRAILVDFARVALWWVGDLLRQESKVVDPSCQGRSAFLGEELQLCRKDLRELREQRNDLLLSLQDTRYTWKILVIVFLFGLVSGILIALLFGQWNLRGAEKVSCVGSPVEIRVSPPVEKSLGLGGHLSHDIDDEELAAARLRARKIQG